MKRMRAAAGAIIVYGSLTIVAVTTLAAFAQAVQTQAPDFVTEPELRAFYYERTAALMVLLIGAIWGAAWKIASALKGHFDGLQGELKASAGRFEAAVEKLSEKLVSHDSSPDSHRDIRRKTDRILDALEDLLERDINPTHHRRRRTGTQEEVSTENGTDDETSV